MIKRRREKDLPGYLCTSFFFFFSSFSRRARWDDGGERGPGQVRRRWKRTRRPRTRPRVISLHASARPIKTFIAMYNAAPIRGNDKRSYDPLRVADHVPIDFFRRRNSHPRNLRIRFFFYIHESINYNARSDSRLVTSAFKLDERGGEEKKNVDTIIHRRTNLQVSVRSGV